MPADPIVVLDQTLRAAGTHYGNVVPWPAGANGVAIQALLSYEDLINPDAFLTLYVEISVDNEQSWSSSSAGFFLGTFRAGTTDYQVPIVEVAQNLIDPQNPNNPRALITHVRARVELISDLSVGLTVTPE